MSMDWQIFINFQADGTVIDTDGFRLNVGIILSNQDGKLFWAKRIGQDAWQFPQGGMKAHETVEQAMYRELTEEVGLTRDHVKILGVTQSWLSYRLPPHLIRHHSRPLCIGQKQRWFILRLIGSETDVRLNLSRHPEFDGWRWVNYWQPLQEVVTFKRQVYEKALRELEPFVSKAMDEAEEKQIVRSAAYSLKSKSRSLQKSLVLQPHL